MPFADWDDFAKACWLTRREHEAQSRERAYEIPLYVHRQWVPTRRMTPGQLRRQHGLGYAPTR